jgi:hypothetical protein
LFQLSHDNFFFLFLLLILPKNGIF